MNQQQENTGSSLFALVFIIGIFFYMCGGCRGPQGGVTETTTSNFEDSSSDLNVEQLPEFDEAEELRSGAMEGDIDRVKAYATQVKKKDRSEALRSLGARNLLLGSKNMDDYLECAKILVNAGAEINARNSSEETALHSAASMGLSSVVKFLVKKGAKLRVRDIKGYSPLDNAYYCKDIVGDRESVYGLFRDYSGTIKFLESIGAPKYK